MDGLRETEADNGVKYCRFFEWISLAFAAWMLFLTVVLHSSYVVNSDHDISPALYCGGNIRGLIQGSTGCLPQLLSEYARAHNQSKFTLADDQLLGINVDYRYSTIAASRQRDKAPIVHPI